MSTHVSNKTFYLWNALVTTTALTFLIWLIYFREGSTGRPEAIALLPALNASLNSLSAILIGFGFWAIKQKKERLHKNLMITAFCVSALFLLSYVYYHSLQGDTKFLGEGWLRPVYFVILISHILLSMTMVPLILSSLFFGLTDKRTTHRKVSKFTFPIWMYVSVTGVIIFFLLRFYS